jgi:hypothetical protein
MSFFWTAENGKKMMLTSLDAVGKTAVHGLRQTVAYSAEKLREFAPRKDFQRQFVIFYCQEQDHK